jgi:mannosylglycoprotein endo-beta-mannosidase
MNGMFSNSRGLGDLAKHVHIADCCRDHNLDFVALSETGRRDYSPSLLNRLSGGIDFEWVSRPPRGRSGGILVGVRADTMEILASSTGEFHIKLHVRNKADNFIWSLVAVYGAAQEDLKADFLRELVNLAKDNPYPILIGGDFNLLRFHHEKSKGHFDGHWPFLFNAVIDSLDLREVSMVGRQFTWANSLPEPTYEKLDRVLMGTDWEDKFPLVSVRALERIEKLSDHAPILLTTGSTRPLGRKQFKFELGWIHRDGFLDMVKNVWDRPVTGQTPIERWNHKMRALRKHLSGWARHITGILKQEKRKLSLIIDDLEALAEVRPLSVSEIELKSQSNAQIASLLREEELKWYQRSKSQFILEGDSNTRYFHSMANGRHRKKHIHSLV